MERTIIMSEKELTRLNVMRDLKNGQIKQSQAIYNVNHFCRSMTIIFAGFFLRRFDEEVRQLAFAGK